MLPNLSLPLLPSPSAPAEGPALVLKPGGERRPLWVLPQGRILMESFVECSKTGGEVYEEIAPFVLPGSTLWGGLASFLSAIAEPVSRTQHMQEYQMTDYSIYSAVSMDLSVEYILETLDKLSKTVLPDSTVAFVRAHAVPGDRVNVYEYTKDPALLELDILPRPESLRDYQVAALNRVFGERRARSGILVLPCGAGKSIVGVMTVATIKKSAIVLCNSSISVQQWYEQFLKFASIDKRSLVRLTSSTSDRLPLGGKQNAAKAFILITTYSMMGYSGKRTKINEFNFKQIMAHDWGTAILDEVHVAPADTFLRAVQGLKVRHKLGLTATLVREDGGVDELLRAVGPRLYEVDWMELQHRGFLATARCVEVWCAMTDEFWAAYTTEKVDVKRRVLSVANPNKVRACETLMRLHEAQGDRIIIFSDSRFAITEFGKLLQRPLVHGGVSASERMAVLDAFRAGTFQTILLSSVGDTSIDVPEANVAIQISSHFGSRRQEAQRLGRILRPKPKGPNVATFYTLVSNNTSEKFFAEKRQRFLVDQGFSYRAWPSLREMVTDPVPSTMDVPGAESSLLDGVLANTALGDTDDGSSEV